MKHGLTLDERIERKSIPEPNSGCLLWLGAVGHNGYPVMNMHGKAKNVHVYKCEQAHGPKKSLGYDAAHSCDTRICIESNHLRWKTRTHNMQEASERGRLERKPK